MSALTLCLQFAVKKVVKDAEEVIVKKKMPLPRSAKWKYAIWDNTVHVD